MISVAIFAIASKLGATKQSTAQIIINLKSKDYLQAEKMQKIADQLI
ncbi:hypothetical protein I588_00319 [Enterococcus pallens ATCC BAA-351]|uniref:Uncharacterized protein n=1 Tax=Enterococcus pallens ATCC BAA-351 TaxID=1158607 RepID=R2QGY9_9ENTE|nr:hypothetical protein UAU_02188 [Enterococcus pallens ATCC BAA-351]EOU24332.1 hypothetical protein I588_00319 [Enterococcus pallens ATCC BAA-351]OJG81886.1 hypothetical protein RV10_GL001750 [Enterococcus pallens]